jgi:hypothetical protein
MRNEFEVIGGILAIVILFTVAFLVGFAMNKDTNWKDGYVTALDDIRLGKTPRYKLEQTAEKWVEVAE